jgi:hypothetical protein
MRGKRVIDSLTTTKKTTQRETCKNKFQSNIMCNCNLKSKESISRQYFASFQIHLLLYKGVNFGFTLESQKDGKDESEGKNKGENAIKEKCCNKLIITNY